MDTMDASSNSDDLESDCYTTRFFRELQDLRSERLLIDVTLCAEGKEIPCHRLVLAAFTEYFRAMLCGGHSESKKDKIEIGGVSAEALQLLVDFAYSSEVSITADNVQPLLEAAHMLRAVDVECKCETFLTDHLSPETCLSTWGLADKLSCTDLSGKARTHALKKFEEVCMTEEFLELPFGFLKMYISDEGLCAKREEQVLDVIMLWVKHDLEERQGHLKELMECVCFSHVDQTYLKNMMETDQVFSGAFGINTLIEDESRCAISRQIHQDDILVLGGSTGKREMNSNMYRLDLNGDCVDTTALPASLQCNKGSAACVVDNDVIVTGGSNWSHDQAWRYKTSENSWIRLGCLTWGRRWHGMVTLNGQVYVVGGWTDLDQGLKTLQEDVEVYRERSNRWKKRAPMKRAVYHFGIAACCGKIYVFGGCSGHSADYSHLEGRNLQCFDPTQNKWTVSSLKVPNTGRRIKACTINSKIYLVGGQLECVYCYDPQEDCFKKKANKVTPWDGCSATVCGSEIFISGGCASVDGLHYGSTFYKAVQCYNVNSDYIILAKDLPVKLYGHNSVTIAKH